MAEYLYDSERSRIADRVKSVIGPELTKLRRDFADKSQHHEERLDALEKKLDRLLALLEPDTSIKGLKMRPGA